MTRADIIDYLKSYIQPPQMMKVFPSCEVIREAIAILEQQPKPQGLDEAAIDAADRLLKEPKDYAIAAKADYSNGVVNGFKAGAEWMEQQISKLPDNLESAANSYVGEKNIESYDLVDVPEVFKAGAKWAANLFIPVKVKEKDAWGDRDDRYFAPSLEIVGDAIEVPGFNKEFEIYLKKAENL